MKAQKIMTGSGISLALLFSAAAARAALPDFTVSTGVPLLQQAASTGTVVGRGGNYAVPLPDGGTLWLANNVWLGERKEDGQHAVWGIVDGAAAVSAGSAPYAQAAAAYVSDENGWPLTLLSGEVKEYSQARKYRPRAGLYAGGRYYAFYSVLNNYGPDLYDNFRVGQGIAWAVKPGGPYVKVPAGGAFSLWSDVEPAFGSAVLEEGGWVYVYGRAMTEPGEYGAALARVKPADLGDRGKYSYFSVEGATPTWTGDASEASAVLAGMPEEFSVSYNELLKSFLCVYADAAEGAVYARTAPFPWGPWGEPARLLACAAEEYCAGAKEQPAFSADDGAKIFFTVEKKNAPYLYELNFK